MRSKKTSISLLGLLFTGLWAMSTSASEQLPISYEASFRNAMDNPQVILYYADKEFQKGNYSEALRWMLNAAEYQVPAAIENSKFMISKNMGTAENRQSVIAFLEFISQDKDGRQGDAFAQIYLADFYRGDNCVWTSDKSTGTCSAEQTSGPAAANDLKKSYFFYDKASESHQRARYHAGMMDLLGLGAPRNVPYAIERLSPLAEQGNANIAFLLGEIHQQGFWVVQNHVEADKWFSMAAQKMHPGAMIALAQNALRGTQGESDTERAKRASSLFIGVTESVTATDEQQAEAQYRLALLYASHPALKSFEKAKDHMEFSGKLGQVKPNEYSVMAYHWLGKQYESNNINLAKRYYEDGVVIFDKLTDAQKQKQASILQSLAVLHTRGEKRSEEQFSALMNRYHTAMSKPALNATNNQQAFGFSAFIFPG